MYSRQCIQGESERPASTATGRPGSKQPTAGGETDRGEARARTKQNETAIHNKDPDQGQLLWSQRHDSPKEHYQLTEQITEALDAEG